MPDPGTPLIALRGVWKRYVRGQQSVDVLQGIDLDIEEGDFIALMGPSGSGKTTLLNLIGGLDQPTAGSVSVDGQRIDGLSSAELAAWRARNIGFIFQFYNLLPMLSARRNVELPLLLTALPGSERKRRALLALELVGLAARALVSDPRLLICDEPTGDLDRHTADEILSLLRVLNDRHGKTVLMVTHDPKAAGYARRQIHLDKGVLVGEADAGVDA